MTQNNNEINILINKENKIYIDNVLVGIVRDYQLDNHTIIKSINENGVIQKDIDKTAYLHIVIDCE